MNITIIAGSNRSNATSTKLSKYVKKILEEKQHQVQLFDLYEQPIPLYNPDNDEEQNINLKNLNAWTKEADAIVLSTPEYHGGISGVLKNALDYLGREQFDQKSVLSISSSGGAVGISSLLQLQTIVRNVHGFNCPDWISIGGGDREFFDNGEPKNNTVKERVNQAINTFLLMTEKLSAKEQVNKYR